MTATGTIDYAHPATGRDLGRRRWSRIAIAALAWVIAVPVLVEFPLLVAVHRGRLPSHLFCCDHPALAGGVFVGMPLGGCLLAVVAVVQTVGRRRHRGGFVLAGVAMVIGLGLAALGVALVGALRA